MRAHPKDGMPQESEDSDFAESLFVAVRRKTVPVDPSHALGYQPPEVWERWLSIVEAGLAGPIGELADAYTNDFIGE